MLLRGVGPAGETGIEPRGPVALKEAAEVPVAAHRHDRQPLCIEIVTQPLGEHLNGSSVARPFYEYDSSEECA